MSIDHSDEVGWPATPTRVYSTARRPNERAEITELFPLKSEPKVLEPSASLLPAAMNWKQLCEERRRYG